MTEINLRPLVRKHLPTFQRYLTMKEIGPEKVRGALLSKDGHYKDVRIKFPFNGKDKRQMLQVLGL